MFDLTPARQADISNQDLTQDLLDNPDLFPEITDPKGREEAILGFEQYSKVINDIFMDQLRDRQVDHITENNLRDAWQKRFENPADQRRDGENNECRA